MRFLEAILNIVVGVGFVIIWPFSKIIKIFRRLGKDVANNTYRRLINIIGAIVTLIIIGLIFSYFNIPVRLPQF